MAQTTFKAPKNKNEEAEVEKGLAEYKLSRIEAAREFLTGESVTKVREEVAALLEEGLPAGSAALGNLTQLPGWLDRAVAGLDSDVQAYSQIANPPAAGEPGGPPPVIPAVPPVPLV